LVGMTANAVIQVGQVTDATLIPTLALQRTGEGYQVLIPNPDPNGQPMTVPVEIGLSNGTYTQITKGLTPGDQVLAQFATTSTNNNNFLGGGGLLGGGLLGGIEGGGGPAFVGGGGGGPAFVGGGGGR
jgi:multidrug efflux pump subunit AcrA (membrane-fusion protein)